MACLFCRIAARELPSAELLDDAHVFAFLDINPLRTGHALVVPKRHAATLAEARAEDAMALMAAARRLRPALAAATGAPDATLAIHDGPAAGQEVPHLHLHIVPRRAGDGGGPIHKVFEEGRPRPGPEDLHDVAVRVQSELAREA